MTNTLPTASELAETIKAEVLALIAAGTIPSTVATFAELHDYVDANCLGGTEALLESLTTPDADDAAGTAALNTLAEVLDPAQNAVDAWLKAGR